MARIHGIVVLVAIAGGTALWFAAAEGDPIAPPLAEPVEPTPQSSRQGLPDAASARSRVDSKESQEEPTIPSDADVIAPPDPAPTAAPVELSVRSLADRLPIERFAWRFLPDQGQATKGEGKAGMAALTIARGARGRLLVEAEGKQPHVQDLIVPTAGGPPLLLDLFLVDVAQSAGVTLQLVDPRGDPIERARLDCWSIEATALAQDSNVDPTHAPLWKRVGLATAGTLTLPELAPGHYALRTQAVDADGFALPLQPRRFRFAFLGGEQVPLRAAFLQGVVLKLQCQDDGATPAAVDVTTRLLAGGDAIATSWQSRGADGRDSIGGDVVMLPADVRSAFALPPGAYSVELRRGAVAQTFVSGPTQDGTATYVVSMPR